MRKNYLFLFIITCMSFSCIDSKKKLPRQVTGYVPIYSNAAVAKIITAGPPRPTIKGGKIYTTGNLLFQVERDSGIHVIDYSNAASPLKLGFIRSVLCKELSVRNGFIYTNNLSDLVVIDINNMNNVREVNRVASVFPDLAAQYPTPASPNSWGTIYFECPDQTKGVVIGWQQTTIKNPKCWK